MRQQYLCFASFINITVQVQAFIFLFQLGDDHEAKRRTSAGTFKLIKSLPYVRNCRLHRPTTGLPGYFERLKKGSNTKFNLKQWRCPDQRWHESFKKKGKVAIQLEELLIGKDVEANIGIGHTRWALVSQATAMHIHIPLPVAGWPSAALRTMPRSKRTFEQRLYFH